MVKAERKGELMINNEYFNDEYFKKVQELIQSWNTAKQVASENNDYVNKAIDTYKAYNKFKESLESRLDDEYKIKQLGYPVEKKKQYLNSEDCFKKASLVKKSLDDLVIMNDEHNSVNELLTKNSGVYKELLHKYNETITLRKITGVSQIAMMLIGNKVKVPNSDLVKKIDSKLMLNCLSEYEALEFIGNKEKLSEARKEIDKICNNKEFKKYKVSY